MKKTLLLFTLLVLAVISSYAQPTDNAIATYYSGDEGYPAWTDKIKWNNVITMSDQGSGAANVADFKAKRDILYSQGGGVLYYPAGTYIFDISDAPNSEGLMLKKGVVIRGEKPTTDANAVLPNPDITSMTVNDHGLNNMPTKFKFTTTRLTNDTLKGDIAKMWNCIGIKSGSNETGIHQVEKVGICWVEIEYGYIYFGFDTEQGWATTYADAGFNYGNSIEPWKSNRVPDGTHPMDWFCGNKAWGGANRLKMGTKRFVFGVHLKHGGCPNYVAAQRLNPNLPAAQTFYCEDGPWWFGSKIGVYGSNVLVANNVISKATKSFKIKISVGAVKIGQSCSVSPVGAVVEVPYDFGKGLSIDVNKCYVAGFANNSAVDDTNSQYAPNVLVMDNWVYNHSNKGFELAGGWMVVKNNINRRERLNHTDVYGLGLTTFYGIHAGSGRIWSCVWNDDMMARAFSISSKNAWYHKNQFINLGSDFDNSGEGMLHQDHINGSECYSAALTYNRGTSYMGVWNSLALGYFLGYNEASVNIMLANLSGGYHADISSVKHGPFNSTAYYNFNISDPAVKDSQSFDCSSGGITPGTPTITVKDTADFVLIKWSNVANEAAYRVEKKKTSSSVWSTIAYRPRQETGCVVSFNGVAPSIYSADGHGADAWDGKVRDMNPAAWRDYLKSSGQYQYRVVAIGCDDLTSTAIATPVTVNIVTGVNELTPAAVNSNFVVYPNPVEDMLFGIIKDEVISSVKIYSTIGLLVLEVNNINASDFSLNVNGLLKGNYIVKVSTEKGSYKELIFKK